MLSNSFFQLQTFEKSNSILLTPYFCIANIFIYLNQLPYLSKCSKGFIPNQSLSFTFCNFPEGKTMLIPTELLYSVNTQ